MRASKAINAPPRVHESRCVDVGATAPSETLESRGRLNSGSIAHLGSSLERPPVAPSLRLEPAPIAARWFDEIEQEQTSRLSKAEQKALGDHMFDEAVTHLRSQGVAFTIEKKLFGAPIIVFNGTSADPFSRNVAGIKRMGGRVIYAPHALVSADADGLLRGNQICLGREDVRDLAPATLTRLHEVIHLRTLRETIRGEMTPYAGQALAVVGLLPPGISGPYAIFQSFDEMRTITYELRLILKRCERQWRDDDTVLCNGRREHAYILEATLMMALHTSMQSAAIADMASRKVTAEPECVQLSNPEGRLIASVSVVHGIDAFEAKIPCGTGDPPGVGLSSILPSERRKRSAIMNHLRSQLAWTHTTGTGHTNVLHVLTQAFPTILDGKPADARRALSACIDLLTVRKFASDRNRAAPTYEEMLARYNDVVTQ